MESFDLIIIGGGSAGFSAAARASELGVKTAVINDGLLGGTCVNVGCVPIKHLLEVSNAYYYPQRTPFKGFRVTGSDFNFKAAMRDKDEIVESMRRDNYINVIRDMPDVTLFKGRARFTSTNRVEINGQILEAPKFVITTGSRSHALPLPGVDKVSYLTNIEALSLKSQPRSLVVVGGGPLGLEFAQLFFHFGTEVTLLEKEEQILPLEEPEVSEELRKNLSEEGIRIHTGVDIIGLREEDNLKVVDAKIKGSSQSFRAEQLLMATGVVANTENIGLESAGVETERGSIKVNQEMRTTASHVWAAGDVVGGLCFEPVAAKEGYIAVSNAIENSGKTIDYGSVPHTTFTNPQAASVGWTEEAFTEKFKICACRVVLMSYVPKAKAIKDTRGLIKMVINPQTLKIVGVHIVSPLAGDLIHEGTLAVKFGLTIDEIIDTVHVFPTLSESIKLAAQAFRRDVTKMSCCVE